MSPSPAPRPGLRDFEPYQAPQVDVPAETINTYDTGLTEDFVRAFATEAAMRTHVCLKAGRSPHHVVEAEFKAIASAPRTACSPAGSDATPSTKGTS